MNRETMTDDFVVTLHIPKRDWIIYKELCKSVGIHKDGNKTPLAHNSELFLKAIKTWSRGIKKKKREIEGERI